MLVERILDHKAASITQYPVHTNRASNLGHPCTRYLVFERTKWEEKTLHGPGLQMVFDLGNDIEDRVMKDLRDAGVSVIEQQRSFSWREHQITGHIDAKVMIDGTVYPIEVKSMSPFAFEKVNEVQDMHNSKYHYMRSYPAQMTLYLLMDNKDVGFFLLKNKVSGAMKEIRVDLDYDLGESLLKKADTINAHVASNTVPGPIEWDDNICSECGYLHICTPDRIGKEIQMVDDAELEAMLSRRESLLAAHKEYESIDRELKDAVKERDKLLVGNWLITGKWQERGEYSVKATKFWVPKFAKVI
jgi:CRISPR/Cas system-associated exonuclease Cas4 (RecB family)